MFGNNSTDWLRRALRTGKRFRSQDFKFKIDMSNIKLTRILNLLKNSQMEKLRNFLKLIILIGVIKKNGKE